MIDSAPLTFGQLSVWRDVDRLPRERWHEANAMFTITVPDASLGAVRPALDTLVARHPSLQTVYDVTDPAQPTQRVDPAVSLGLEHATVEGDRDAEELLAAFVSRPFDLRCEAPARALLLDRPSTRSAGSGSAGARAGRGRLLAISKHHIAADAWAADLLEAELVGLLAGHAETLPPPSEDLGLLAVEQRSPAWKARRDASDRHHAGVFATPAASFAVDEPEAGVMQGSFESAAFLTAADGLARRAGVSLSTVLLSAYTAAVARHCDHDAIRLGLMSSNRFGTRWRGLVTSMNQWVPMTVAGARDTVEAAALPALQATALRAYRVALRDVDAPRPAACQTAPTCTYNLITPWPLTPGFDPATEPVEPEIVWENAFSAIGPRCYLRIFQTPQTLIVSLRTTGLGRELTEDVLRTIRTLITAQQ